MAQEFPLSDFPVRRVLSTRWGDNDAFGHVNNAVYYALFDSALTGWLTETCEASLTELPGLPVIAESSCRFIREMAFPGNVVIGLGLERRGTSSVIYRLGLFREVAGGPASELHALGRIVQVYVDRDTRRPTKVPDVVARALDRL